MSANGNSYTCDDNGNVIGGSTLSQIWYDANNHARSVSRSGAGTMGWAYDSNGKPAFEVDGAISRVYGPAGYELANGVSRHELGPVIVTCSGANGACGQPSDRIIVALRDRLGSTIDTTEAGGNTRAYDAFGKVRNGDMSDRSPPVMSLANTIHGFTKHEQADSVQLIHMGGRIYDYQLGRFLNVDPLIGNPASSQSLNPYSYIGNNPLSGVDPTGYQCVGSNIESQTCEGTGAAVIQVADHSHDTANNGSSPGQGTQTRTPQQQEAPNLGNTAIQAPKVASQGADAPQGQDPMPQPQQSSVGVPTLPTVTVRPIAEPLPKVPGFLIQIIEPAPVVLKQTPWLFLIVPQSGGNACECSCGSTICGPYATPRPITPAVPGATPGFGDASGMRGPTTMTSDQPNDASDKPSASKQPTYVTPSQESDRFRRGPGNTLIDNKDGSVWQKDRGGANAHGGE